MGDSSYFRFDGDDKTKYIYVYIYIYIFSVMDQLIYKGQMDKEAIRWTLPDV